MYDGAGYFCVGLRMVSEENSVTQTEIRDVKSSEMERHIYAQIKEIRSDIRDIEVKGDDWSRRLLYVALILCLVIIAGIVGVDISQVCGLL